jgi:hypothetical protein
VPREEALARLEHPRLRIIAAFDRRLEADDFVAEILGFRKNVLQEVAQIGGRSFLVGGGDGVDQGGLGFKGLLQIERIGRRGGEEDEVLQFSKATEGGFELLSEIGGAFAGDQGAVVGSELREQNV